MIPDSIASRVFGANAKAVARSFDLPVGALRAVSIALLMVFTWLWHMRTTGKISLTALALLAGVVLTSLSIGNLCARASSRIVAWQPGVAYEVLLGFFCANTLLFVLTLVSPLGIGLHVAFLGILAALAPLVPVRNREPAGGKASGEWGSLVCIAFSGVATTLWVHEQQPVLAVHEGFTTVRAWLDIFIHTREISAFAQAHGLQSLNDIKLAGAVAPVYHFASYMLPAALNALTPTSAIDSYVAFQLPFGILLTGLATYGLTAVLFGRTWPAVVAATVVMAFPDTYGLAGVHFLAYHFMTQANLGMLYGLACAALAWIFMIEGCRNARLLGVAVAYLLLGVCATYKVHLFVANALILMLYPCAFFKSGRLRIPWWWRTAAAMMLVAIFVAVVQASQLLPRVPTLRLDGSGLHYYVNILMSGTRDGWFKRAFVSLYYERKLPWAVNASLAALVIVFGTYGGWTLLAPWLFFKARFRVPASALIFAAIVVVNYQGMAMLLALDARGVGTPEEFVDRPHAWAYLVVVACASACAAILASELFSVSRICLRWMAVGGAALMLVSVYRHAHELQTFPEWEGHAVYAEFNALPTCLVDSARYIRERGSPSDLMQDSRFDPGLVVTALAERQAFVIDSTFGGRSPAAASRVARIATLQAEGDPPSLIAWARENRVRWYLMRPDDAMHWAAPFLDQAAHRCEAFRVFRFEAAPR